MRPFFVASLDPVGNTNERDSMVKAVKYFKPERWSSAPALLSTSHTFSPQNSGSSADAPVGSMFTYYLKLSAIVYPRVFSHLACNLCWKWLSLSLSSKTKEGLSFYIQVVIWVLRSVSPGDKVQPLCTHRQSDYRVMLWYQKLIGYNNNDVLMEKPYEQHFITVEIWVGTMLKISRWPSRWMVLLCSLLHTDTKSLTIFHYWWFCS